MRWKLALHIAMVNELERYHYVTGEVAWFYHPFGVLASGRRKCVKGTTLSDADCTAQYRVNNRILLIGTSLLPQHVSTAIGAVSAVVQQDVQSKTLTPPP